MATLRGGRMARGPELSAKAVALVAVFAALYVALSLLPGLPTPGDPTGSIKIEIEASLAPLYGLILGPYLGALAAFIGTVLAWLLPPSSASIFGVPALACPAVDALVVGLMVKKRWKAAFSLLAIFIVAYWLSPICLPITAYWYVGLAGSFDKLIALALVPPVALMLERSSTWREPSEGDGISGLTARTGLLFALSFIGNEADSALGCAAYAFFLTAFYPLDAIRFYYTMAPLIYFLVRVIQALIATAVGVPLLRALKRARLEVAWAV